MRVRRIRYAGAALAVAAVACAWVQGERAGPLRASPETAAERIEGGPRSGGPFLRVLGTVQDGGLPHAACACDRCETARRDPSRARRIASLALVLPEARRVYLVDATPDLRQQLDALRDLRPVPAGGIDRSPLDGIFLTHAHMGHYTGLLYLGFESLHVRGLPTHGSARMLAYLRSNGPWSQMVRLEEVRLVEIGSDRPILLEQGVAVGALPVPHRAEFTDTLAYVIGGPRAKVLYAPDTDGWDAWRVPIEDVVADVEIALLDGTFYSRDELPDRDPRRIGHPRITDTMDRLEPVVRRHGTRVYFTHLNHSNPALDPEGAARRAVEERGFHVLEEGQEFPL